MQQGESTWTFVEMETTETTSVEAMHSKQAGFETRRPHPLAGQAAAALARLLGVKGESHGKKSRLVQLAGDGVHQVECEF